MATKQCVVCGRYRMFEGEGRHIDGSWSKDAHVPNRYWGEWVCSYACYRELLGDNTGGETNGN